MLRDLHGGGWSNKFVIDDAEFLAFAGKLEHQFDKIQSTFGAARIVAVNSRYADHEMAGIHGAHKQLSGEFGIAIDIERHGCVLLNIGRVLAAIKNVVSADVHERRAGLLRDLGQIARTDSVNVECQTGLGFAFVNVVESCRVHNKLWLRLTQHCAYGFQRGNFEVLVRETCHCMASSAKCGSYIPAQLTVAPNDHDFHRFAPIELAVSFDGRPSTAKSEQIKGVDVISAINRIKAPQMGCLDYFISTPPAQGNPVFHPHKASHSPRISCSSLLMLIDYGHEQALYPAELTIFRYTPMSSPARKYDLAVAYRIYPEVSKPALGLPFSNSKDRLSEVCLQSFRRSLGDLRVKVWVLLDGCPPGYEEMFRRVFAPEDLVLEALPKIGNHGTFERQIDILLKQEDADLVYFAEDDYFYLPDQFKLMTEFLHSNPNVDFVSPFDHLDCYTLELHRRPAWLRVFQNRHWRTAASTCLTFLTTRSTLQETQRIFRTYSGRNFDCSLWLSLTKQNVLRPWDVLRWTVRRPHLAKIIAKAWLFGWSQILFGKQYMLWSPIPGIATHLDCNALSPTIDWSALMQEQCTR